MISTQARDAEALLGRPVDGVKSIRLIHFFELRVDIVLRDDSAWRIDGDRFVVKGCYDGVQRQQTERSHS